MVRYLVGFICVLALGLMGCSETAGTGGMTGQEFACTEQGIRDAIAEGGGPHTFDCHGPQTVVTLAEIEIDNDVILDGEGNLTVDAQQTHRVFLVATDITAEFRGFTVSGGNAKDPRARNGDKGGGIYNGGTVTLMNSTVSGNVSEATGGGIFNEGPAKLTLTNSTVSGNTAWGGGGIFNASLAELTLTNSTVSGNVSTGANGGGGGGIYNGGTVTLMNSTVSGNVAAFTNPGGGIFNEGPAKLTLTNSTVSGNVAWGGGGIYNTTLTAGDGTRTAGTVTLMNSTVSGNVSTGANGGGGGGIYNGGTVTLMNSTVSGNVSTGANGGGISNASRAELTLTSSTVSGNGIHNDGTATLMMSLVDGDCLDAITSHGYNIESPGNTCGFDQATDQVDVSAVELNLGPLQDNGGPTMTHALAAGSVAIDWIPEADCGATTDQRGEPRPETGGTMCDVGAFEVQP
jgi:hypothetical protein